MRSIFLSVIVLSIPAAAWAQAESPRLVAAKKECWQQVGVYGDPNKTRGSIQHMDTVTACVRQKMGTAGKK